MRPSVEPGPGPASHHRQRLEVLDGSRAISILLVLACHMLPLGPRRWELNGSAGLAGMSLFFALSGFLIIITLDRNSNVPAFLIRRLFRIVPLAIAVSVFALTLLGKDWSFYPAHFLYYVNYDHSHISGLTGHLWSLCVEVHFYLMAAALTALLGFRGLLLLPLLGLAVTLLRIYQGSDVNIMTHLRIDEIMSGAVVGMIWLGRLGQVGRRARALIERAGLPVWAVLFVVASHPASGPLIYFRQLFASSLVGCSLWRPGLSDQGPGVAPAALHRRDLRTRST